MHVALVVKTINVAYSGHIQNLRVTRILDGLRQLYAIYIQFASKSYIQFSYHTEILYLFCVRNIYVPLYTCHTFVSKKPI